MQWTKSATWLGVTAAAFVVAAPAFAQQDELAKSILQESAEAIKGLKSVSFVVKFSGSADLRGEGQFRMVRAGATPSFAFKGEFQAAGTRVGQVAVRDGKDVSWVNDAERTVFRVPLAPRSEALGQVNRLQTTILPPPLRDADPYRREMTAAKLSVEDMRDVRGELCQVVRATFDKGQTSVIAIGSTDRLPRLYETSKPLSGDAKLLQTWELREVVPDAKITAKDLEVPTPVGFTVVTEDPAVKKREENEKKSTPASGPAPAAQPEAEPASKPAEPAPESKPEPK